MHICYATLHTAYPSGLWAQVDALGATCAHDRSMRVTSVLERGYLTEISASLGQGCRGSRTLAGSMLAADALM